MLKSRRFSSQSALDDTPTGEHDFPPTPTAFDDHEHHASMAQTGNLSPHWVAHSHSYSGIVTAPGTTLNSPYHSNNPSRIHLALPHLDEAINEAIEEDATAPKSITIQVPPPNDRRRPAHAATLELPPSRWQEALTVPTSQRGSTLPSQQNPSQFHYTLTGPNGRFKSIVLKVIALNRMRLLSDEEPGVQDPASDAAAAVYGHIKEKCSISVADFGPTFAKFVDLSDGGAAALEEFIKAESPDNAAYGPGAERPLWSKVRWICVGGVSWDVIKCLALRYQLHPLAIEDLLHSRQTYSSKADYYLKHLFVRILSHTLVDEDEPKCSPPVPPDSEPEEDHDCNNPSPLYSSPASSQATIPDPEKAPSSTAKPGTLSAELLEMRKSVQSQARKYSHHLSSMFESNLRPGHRASTTQATVNELKREERVKVRLRNLYIALFRDGTVITIHQDPYTPFFQPIWTRLKQRDSLLRSSGDASLLLQHLIDLVVDNAVHIVDRYHEQLLKFERDILVKPKVSTVKYLHIASGDITMHKRTLAPLKSLVYGLRRYDLDRVMALRPGHGHRHYEEGTAGVKVSGGHIVTGFMSPKSKTYLADVFDHVEYILASLEMFESITENLIAYTFNVVSYDMNTTMRTLTIATVAFFPPSLLTGYFGMNFPDLAPIEARGHGIFWALAVPIVVLIILIFSAPRFSELLEYARKKRIMRTVIRTRGGLRDESPGGRAPQKCQDCGKRC